MSYVSLLIRWSLLDMCWAMRSCTSRQTYLKKDHVYDRHVSTRGFLWFRYTVSWSVGKLRWPLLLPLIRCCLMLSAICTLVWGDCISIGISQSSRTKTLPRCLLQISSPLNHLETRESIVLEWFCPIASILPRRELTVVEYIDYARESPKLHCWRMTRDKTDDMFV